MQELMDIEKDITQSVLAYSFANPFLAINYKEQFMNSEDSKCGYTQGCKWAPDGSCFLVASDDKKLRTFNLPLNVASGEFSDENWIMGGWKEDIKLAPVVKEADNIYDYQWYPLMQSANPNSSCFAVTCRELPIHLWNVWTGQLVGSYLYYNHLEMMVPATSLGFSPDGLKLVAGYAKGIRVFDVDRPGRCSTTISSQGQYGIISTLAFHPQLRKIFAAGSYSSSVGIYSLESKRVFALFEGHAKGVTHLQFTSDGTKLFSGTRKDDEIICWDIRNPGNILAVFKRQPTTNQKMYFDITPFGDHYLLSGTTDGKVLIWDISESLSKTASSDSDVLSTTAFTAHDDCVNGISIHPSRPILATSSGQRTLPRFENTSTSDYEEESLMSEKLTKSESSVKLWWIGTTQN